MEPEAPGLLLQVFDRQRLRFLITHLIPAMTPIRTVILQCHVFLLMLDKFCYFNLANRIWLVAPFRGAELLGILK